MSATQNDTFPLPAFEDRLWDELAHLQAELAAGAADEGGEDGSSRRPSRGTSRRRYLAAVAALAAAASIAAVTLVVRQNDDTTGTATEEEEADPPPDASPPTETPTTDAAPPSVLPAGADANGVVAVRAYTYADGSLLTYWTDEATDAYRRLALGPDGTPRSEDGIAIVENADGSRTSTQTAIDHVLREYWVAPPYGVSNLPNEAEVLADLIEAGQLVADGTEEVDGVDLLRYVLAPSQPGSEDCETLHVPPELCEAQAEANSATPTPRVIWADPATGLPVKESVTSGIGDYTVTYTYVPRTPENLAQTQLQVPAGYTQVDDLSDGLG